MIEQIIEEAKPKMENAILSLESDLAKIRTGRAHQAILDGIFISYYGTSSALKEVASITIPEPTVIAIKPWEKGILSDIESAIRNSDLGLSPVNDGVQIRLVLPPMTEERRKEIFAIVKKYGEDAKIALRNCRGDAWGKVQASLKNKEITEDDKYSAEEKLNKLIDEKNKAVDRIIAEKEAEIMKI